MKAKCVEILDRATFIPAVALSTLPENEGQRYLLSRAGYSPEGGTIFLVNLSGGRAHCDPYDWKDRTMTAAHLYLEAHWSEIEDGAVLDVEFILGETKKRKPSEAVATSPLSLVADESSQSADD